MQWHNPVNWAKNKYKNWKQKRQTAEQEKITRLEYEINFNNQLNRALALLNSHIVETYMEMKGQALRIMGALVLKQGGRVLVEKEFFETITNNQSARLRIKTQENGDTLFEIASEEPNEEGSVHTSQ